MGSHHERKPMRLPGYDYSLPGAYFVTTCTRNREFLFGSSEAKLAVESAWHSLLDIFANIELDEFVVMPNHSHGVIWIVGEGAYVFILEHGKMILTSNVEIGGCLSLHWIIKNLKPSATSSVHSKQRQQHA